LWSVIPETRRAHY